MYFCSDKIRFSILINIHLLFQVCVGLSKGLDDDPFGTLARLVQEKQSEQDGTLTRLVQEKQSEQDGTLTRLVQKKQSEQDGTLTRLVQKKQDNLQTAVKTSQLSIRESNSFKEENTPLKTNPLTLNVTEQESSKVETKNKSSRDYFKRYSRLRNKARKADTAEPDGKGKIINLKKIETRSYENSRLSSSRINNNDTKSQVL